MSECIGEDEPLISIVLAVYHPRMDWLIEQLDSLNAQTYPRLELIVCDDGPDAPVEEAVFARHITAFRWTLVRNEQNLGSNKTFERLTAMANGVYIAYCDQDDVWLPEKLCELLKVIRQSKVTLACSDAIVINMFGEYVSNSITKIRKRHIFRSGEGLASSLLFRNFVIGCTMLVYAEKAKEAIPFVTNMVHDHWIALWAANCGGIAVAHRPLVRYRIHDRNQTSVFANVSDKESYIKQRILLYTERMNELHTRIDLGETQRMAEAWGNARLEFAHHIPGAANRIWRLRKLNIPTTLFELLMLRMPESVFLLAVRIIRRGKI